MTRGNTGQLETTDPRIHDRDPTSTAPIKPSSIAPRSSTTARSDFVPERMSGPTLGCQIAPHYHHDYDSDSDSDTTDTESEVGSPVQEEITGNALNIEKAETQHSHGITPALSKINTQRSRRSRKDSPPEAVGFWNWQMVMKPKA